MGLSISYAQVAAGSNEIDSQLPLLQTGQCTLLQLSSQDMSSSPVTSFTPSQEQNLTHTLVDFHAIEDWSVGQPT